MSNLLLSEVQSKCGTRDVTSIAAPLTLRTEGAVRMAENQSTIFDLDMRPVPGWLGYMAGADGHVYSLKRWRGCSIRRLAPALDKYGYYRVTLTKNQHSTAKNVHRIICTAFHGEQRNRQHQVRHLDGNKANNRPENLKWGTAKENADDRERHGRTARGESHGKSHLTDVDVRCSAHLVKRGLPLVIIAAHIGSSPEALRSRIAILEGGCNVEVAQ